jgi:tetratricopeptide (TPR) repeat protein
MRAYVFTDASLGRYAGQFVWLSVDIDNPGSSKFITKFQTPGVPTFFVIDPKSESVTTRYVGGFTVASLKKFLNENGGPKAIAPPVDDALMRADRLATEAKYDDAAKAYEAALKTLPAKSARYGRAAEGFIFSLQMTRGGEERCAEHGFELAKKLAGTVSGANLAALALDCESGLKPEERKQARFEALEKMVSENVRNKTLDLSGDDRSGYYITLIGAHDAIKDDAGAKKLRQEWSAFLDGQAAKAKTAEERAVYDPHRLSAYMELGEPQKAIPMLERSMRDFPKDYNPLSRLSVAYKAMKMWDESISYAKRALALSEGPRRITIYRNLADAYLGKGDKEAARATLKEAIAYDEKLPEGQRNENVIASLKKKLESV